jgi:hypothetical protein
MSDLWWRRRLLIGLTIFAFAQFAGIVVMQTTWFRNLPGLPSQFAATSVTSVSLLESLETIAAKLQADGVPPLRAGLVPTREAP